MKTICWLFFLLFVLTPSLFAASQKGLKIEGIVYDGKDKDNSYAVVGGNFLKKGDTYQGYKITSVGSTSIQAVDATTGKEQQFHITGGEPSSFLPPVANIFSNKKKQESGPSSTDAAGQKQEGPNPISQIIEQFRSMLGVKEGGGMQFPGSGAKAKKGDSPNPLAQLMNVAWEIKAVVELKNMYQMAAYYYLTKGVHAKAPADLVQEKMLSEEFKDGENGLYRFYIQGSSDNLIVHADPVEPDSGLKYFCVEDGGPVRVEQRKPATPESPAIAPSNMLPWMQK